MEVHIHYSDACAMTCCGIVACFIQTQVSNFNPIQPHALVIRPPTSTLGGNVSKLYLYASAVQVRNIQLQLAAAPCLPSALLATLVVPPGASAGCHP